VLRKKLPELAPIDETLAEQARAIVDDEPGILAAFHGILEFGLGGQRIRTHGDYHLGQVLNSGRDFLIIDFEGEPARPLSERRMKRSPLRDVAGMLRSFDYAACTALRQHRERFGISKQDELMRLTERADCWRSWVAAVFLYHYLERIGPSRLLPTSEEQLAMMLDSFLLEKAIYELQYELNNRPDWIGVPVDGIRRLRAGAAT
jgi:maltose alpha-D-glucosyltransferase / alpha-amylase